MLPIFWSPSALDDLDQITDYITQYNVHAATALHSLIENALHPVSEHPYLYRSGRVPGTREIVVHPNYLVVYEVRADFVEVMAVLHSRQQYP